MKITQIRSATNRLVYAGKTFLIDPWLALRHAFSFVDIPGRPYHIPDPMKEHLPMPFYDLPISAEEVLQDVDYIIVTHLHPDHIDMSVTDGTVGAPLDKRVPIFCQNEEDAAVLKRSGFQDITILPKEGIQIGDATIRQVPALHGTYIPCGNAMGVLFEAKEEKTFYLAGDTIWYEEVAATIKKYQPEVIALNACSAETLENGRLIMNDEDVWNVSLAAPHARLYITHMDNVAHAALTRYTMRGRLASRGIVNYDMPADGESVVYLSDEPLRAEGSD